MNNLISISFIFNLFLTFSLDCQINFNLDSLRKSEFLSADIVILAEVIEVDTIMQTSKVKIYETFKGNTYNTLIIQENRLHSIIPYPSGFWIIYAKILSENKFWIPLNSISRSNLNPEKLFYYPPKPVRNKSELKEFEKNKLKSKLDAYIEWNNELYLLRNKLIND